MKPKNDKQTYNDIRYKSKNSAMNHYIDMYSLRAPLIRPRNRNIVYVHIEEIALKLKPRIYMRRPCNVKQMFEHIVKTYGPQRPSLQKGQFICYNTLET